MRRLFVAGLLVICSCSSPPEPDKDAFPLVPNDVVKEFVITDSEPLHFRGDSTKFFMEWFAKTSEWPTQADVDAWEKGCVK